MLCVRNVQTFFMIIYCISQILNGCDAEVKKLENDEVKDITTTEKTDTESNEESSTNGTNILPTPSQLIAYRYEHPVTIYKHKARVIRQKPRRRVKKPKPVYGPPPVNGRKPNNNYHKHLTRNKIYDFDEFKQEFGSDFHIQSVPISTYEKKHIEVDFFENAHKPGGDRKKKNEYHFSDAFNETPNSRHQTRSEEDFSPSESSEEYNYSSNEGDEYLHEPSLETPYEYPQPHDSSNNFNSGHSSSHNPTEYRQQSNQSPYYYPQENPGEYELPSPTSNSKHEPQFHPPANKHRPQTHQHPQANGHSSVNSYIRPPSQASANDFNRPSHVPNNFGKPPHNSNYQPPPPHPPHNNHFAEPPENVHITYSPSIEINPLPPKTEYDGAFPHPTQNHGEYSNNQGNFAEPPNDYYTPNDGNLPLNNNQHHGYDYPKSSYEVPLYDATPFGKNEHQEQYPPVSQYSSLETESYNAPNSKQNQVIQQTAVQKSKGNSNTELGSTTTQNKGSSNKIEVTLKRYPYQSSRNSTNLHLTPSRKVEQELVNQLNNLHSLSSSLDNISKPPRDYLDKFLLTSSTVSPPRKRKRTRIPTNTKHNLDVDELRIAFEANSKYDTSIPDPNLSESKISETTEPSNFVLLSSTNKNLADFSGTLPWEPIKIKPTHNKNFNRFFNDDNDKIDHEDNDDDDDDIITHHSNKKHKIQRNSNDPTDNFENVQVISIEKSRSHSYYAGTMSPSELQNENIFKLTGISSRNDPNDDEILLVSTGIQVSNGDEKNEAVLNRGQVFDEPKPIKTKTPVDVHWNKENLPKNHKLF